MITLRLLDGLYKENCEPSPFKESNPSINNSNEGKANDKFNEWSFDISNMHTEKDESCICVAISRINIEEDMKQAKGLNFVKDRLEKFNYRLTSKRELENHHEKAKIREKSHTALDIPKSEHQSENFSSSDSKKVIAIYCLKLLLKNQNVENEKEKNENDEYEKEKNEKEEKENGKNGKETKLRRIMNLKLLFAIILKVFQEFVDL
jgi:hypothetical protein